MTRPLVRPAPPSDPDRRDAWLLGRTGEEVALDYLRRRGFDVLMKSFRFRRGEIDIVARDRGTLVFVEVKTRAAGGFGRPEDSVTPAKQRQLRKVAEGYLLVNRLGGIECRFDVLCLLRAASGRWDVQHFVNAF